VLYDGAQQGWRDVAVGHRRKDMVHALERVNHVGGELDPRLLRESVKSVANSGETTPDAPASQHAHSPSCTHARAGRLAYIKEYGGQFEPAFSEKVLCKNLQKARPVSADATGVQSTREQQRPM
jgi:hypothetical protein